MTKNSDDINIDKQKIISDTAFQTFKQLKKSAHLNNERIVKVAEILKILATEDY